MFLTLTDDIVEILLELLDVRSCHGIVISCKRFASLFERLSPRSPVWKAIAFRLFGTNTASSLVPRVYISPKDAVLGVTMCTFAWGATRGGRDSQRRISSSTSPSSSSLLLTPRWGKSSAALPTVRWQMIAKDGDLEFAKTVLCIREDAAREFLYVGCNCPNISVVHISAKMRVGTLRGHTAGVISLSLSPSRERLYSGSEDKTIIEWSLDCLNRSALRRFQHASEVASLIALKETVVSGDCDGVMSVFELDPKAIEATIRAVEDRGGPIAETWTQVAQQRRIDAERMQQGVRISALDIIPQPPSEWRVLLAPSTGAALDIRVSADESAFFVAFQDGSVVKFSVQHHDAYRVPWRSLRKKAQQSNSGYSGLSDNSQQHHRHHRHHHHHHLPPPPRHQNSGSSSSSNEGSAATTPNSETSVASFRTSSSLSDGTAGTIDNASTPRPWDIFDDENMGMERRNSSGSGSFNSNAASINNINSNNGGLRVVVQSSSQTPSPSRQNVEGVALNANESNNNSSNNNINPSPSAATTPRQPRRNGRALEIELPLATAPFLFDTPSASSTDSSPWRVSWRDSWRWVSETARSLVFGENNDASSVSVETITTSSQQEENNNNGGSGNLEWLTPRDCESTAEVRNLFVSTDNESSNVYAARGDGSIWRWKQPMLEQKTGFEELIRLDSSVLGLDGTIDNSLLFVATHTGVAVVSVEDAKVIQTLPLSGCRCLVLSEDQSTVYVGDSTGQLSSFSVTLPRSLSRSSTRQ